MSVSSRALSFSLSVFLHVCPKRRFGPPNINALSSLHHVCPNYKT